MAGRVTQLRGVAVLSPAPAARVTQLRATAVVKLGLPPVRVTHLRATAVIVLGGRSFAGSPGGDLW